MTVDPTNAPSTDETIGPEDLHAEVERWGRDTAEGEPRVVRVGYLYSDDQHDLDTGSHLDLIILVEEFDLPPAERVGMWDLGAVPLPAQALVYTMDEWSELMEVEFGLGQRLREQTVWAYER